MAAICGCNQLKVERLILEGYSVFMSGKGGCGKSFLLKQVILGLKRKKVNYFVTATTGIAAVNIGGKTICWHWHWIEGQSRAHITYFIQRRGA